MIDSHDTEAAPIECRICHSKTTRDLILSPCLCKGSLAHVHFSCLERWLNYASRESCELCQCQLSVELHRRYSCLRSARVWLRRPAHRAFVLCDLCIGLVLTTLTLALVFLCYISLSKIHTTEQQLGINNIGPSWGEGIVNIFLVVLLAGYFATMYSMVKDHVRPWYTWWIGCNDVRLILDKKNLTVLVPREQISQDQSTNTGICAMHKSNTVLNKNSLDKLDDKIINDSEIGLINGLRPANETIM